MPKQNIHPKYFDEAQFICVTCNSKFDMGTTLSEEVRVDTCSKCHPFYTGKQTFANAEGRVEKFKEKFAKKDAMATAPKTTVAKVPEKKAKAVVMDLSDLKDYNKSATVEKKVEAKTATATTAAKKTEVKATTTTAAKKTEVKATTTTAAKKTEVKSEKPKEKK
ncbi:50S ribosomal protein L31 [Spiroplasma sp. TIUS-1]|uniref:50S ribosomal protein L31 n=1 Tax=Spiroplasma sp. TIUS-1 TaxID=216963 RepID=UPI0013985517|nr:50S ribosomal protein L31 [Spiroplasma sp. TIUS-1]